jgi:hypothetical protein
VFVVTERKVTRTTGSKARKEFGKGEEEKGFYT